MLTAEHPTEAIPAANTEFARCFAAGDATGIADLYTDSGRLLPPSAPVAEGRSAIAAFWSAAMAAGMATLDLNTEEICTAGSGEQVDLAVETGTFRIGATGGAVLATGKYLVTWRQEAGRWRLHRDIWNIDSSG